jgi:hypothetical protein
VGDETHFFVRHIAIGERTVDVDIVTQFAFVHVQPDERSFNVLEMIAVVQDLGDEDEQPGPVFGPPGSGSGPGDWLACGVFMRAE